MNADSRVTTAFAAARQRDDGWLDLHGLGLKVLPDIPADLRGVRRLDLSGNRLQELPSSLWNLEALEALDLASNRLATLPPDIARLGELRSLDASENRLTTLPSELARCAHLAQVDLFHNLFREVPAAVLHLPALEFLDLSHNRLTVLPDLRDQWQRLTALDLSANQLQDLPDSLTALARLRRLNLSSNRLTDVGLAARLPSLQELFVEDNLLRGISDTFAGGLSPRVRMIAVTGNPLDEFPGWLEHRLSRGGTPHVPSSLQQHIHGGYEPGVQYFDAPRRTFRFSLALADATAAHESVDLYFKQFAGAPVSLIWRGAKIDLTRVTRAAARRVITVGTQDGGDEPATLVFAPTNDNADVVRVSDFATRALNNVAGIQLRTQGESSAPGGPFPGDRGEGPSSRGHATDEIVGAAPRASRDEDTSHAGRPPDAEPVDTAVFCPARVAPGSVFLVQVFLYPPGDEGTVERSAVTADAAATRRATYSLPMDLPRGTRVDLHLEVPSLIITEPDAVVVWRGRPAAAQFDVSVPGSLPEDDLVARVRVAVAGMPAGTLRFKVSVASRGARSDAPSFRPAEAVKYRRGFVSYSSKDRAEVLKRVQAFQIAGFEIFQDILNLDEGERWQRALHEAIDWCDVFLLFWSKAAADSEWVSKEIDLALTRKAGRDDRPPYIQPVPIEGPPLVPPPKSLAELHFNGALLWVIAAEQRLTGDG